jgi:hypothetical protein
MIWKDTIQAFLNDLNEKNLKVGLRQDWFSIYPEEKEEVYRFLYFSKQHKLFVYLFAIDIQSQVSDLPWTYFLKIIEIHKLKVNSKLGIEILAALKKQRLIHLEQFDSKALITEIKKRDRQDFIHNLLKRKQELMASARIAESERLFEQQMEYMEELKKIAPKEYNVQTLISSRDKERADFIIEKRARKKRQEEREGATISAEEKKILGLIEKQAERLVKDGKAKGSDMAYLLRSMGDFPKAIRFIDSSADDIKKNWRLLEYLLEGRQYLSLLDLCMELKSSFSQDPDAQFTISYAEAIAYWELGEKDAALDLMSQISSMRPNFKSAAEILTRWQEESVE